MFLTALRQRFPAAKDFRAGGSAWLAGAFRADGPLKRQKQVIM
jgi:hypothetical protein